MDLACLKGFVDAKSFCTCKQHDIRLKYVCLESTCPNKMQTMCQLCFKSDHKNHPKIEIAQLYHILINEMAGKEENLSLNKEKLLEKDVKLSSQIKQMDTLLFDIEILFKTVKQLYKDTKGAIDSLKELIKETPTPSQQVYHQIENSLIGKHWKESTQKGLNFRLKNIFENVACSGEGGEFQIENSSPEIQHISNQIDYFLSFYNTRLQKCQFTLEECFEMVNLKFKCTDQIADQISFANIYTEQNLQSLPSSATKERNRGISLIAGEPINYILRYCWVIRIRFLVKIGQNNYSLNCMQSFTRKYGNNINSLLINLNGQIYKKCNIEALNLMHFYLKYSWQNITQHHFLTIDQILQPCINLQILVLNLFNWNIESKDNSSDEKQDPFQIVVSSIGRIKSLEALTLFLGKWNGIKSEHIISLTDTLAELPSLQSIDLQFPECRDHLVNDQAIKYMSQKFKLLPNLDIINLNFNGWYRERGSLTEVSLNNILSVLMSRQYKSYSLSILGSNGVAEPYLNRLSYEMKKIKFVTFLY